MRWRVSEFMVVLRRDVAAEFSLFYAVGWGVGRGYAEMYPPPTYSLMYPKHILII